MSTICCLSYVSHTSRPFPAASRSGRLPGDVSERTILDAADRAQRATVGGRVGSRRARVPGLFRAAVALQGRCRAWGFARSREIRTRDGVRSLRPRRALCAECDTTHVLCPAWSVPRRRDSAEVIGEALRLAVDGDGLASPFMGCFSSVRLVANVKQAEERMHQFAGSRPDQREPNSQPVLDILVLAWFAPAIYDDHAARRRRRKDCWLRGVNPERWTRRNTDEPS
jgi:hypothetical protein